MSRLSCETVQHLQAWLAVARIRDGTMFRRLIGRSKAGERLHANIVADIFKRVGKWVMMGPDDVEQISGHTIRVGTTQDLLGLNIAFEFVMQAGRWKAPAIPLRYGEQVLAARGAMARTAAQQRRD